MGRVQRKKGGLVNGSCENVSPKPLLQKSNVKVSDRCIKPVKAVLSDRTNITINNLVNRKCKEVVKFCEPIEEQKVKSNLKSSSNIQSNCSENPKSKGINCVKNPHILLTPPKFTKNGKVKVNKNSTESDKRPQRSSKRILATANKKNKLDITNEKEYFLGFDKAEKSPLLDILLKKIDLCSEITKPSTILSKKNHLPVYRLNKPSPPKMCSNNIDDRLHLYDFEIDENEPVVKKGKRKPILKIKRCRTYKRKKTVNSTPKQLNVRYQENVCPNIQSNNEPQTKGYTPMSPISERSIPDVFNNSIDNVSNASIRSQQSNIENVLRPFSSCHSLKRESLCVPIIRPSVSGDNDNNCSKSLNASACSSRHDISVNSPYTENFMSPLYIGSSTPIHRHWAEQTNNVYSNATSVPCENFDVSNNFGFYDDDLVEEPIVSPIKRFETPLRPVTPKKPTPIKIPQQQVVRLLKFGSEAPVNTSQEEISLPIEELVPPLFFHDGDTPNFSPSSSPVMPVVLKKGMKSNRNQTVKKKVVIVEELDDSDFATQSSEDKTSQEEDSRTERTLRSNQTLLRRTRNNPVPSKTMKSNQTPCKNRTNAWKDESDIEKDKGYETELSPTKQNTTIKKTRRSYERPAYLRPNKFGRNEQEDEDEEEEIVVKEKTQPRKKNAPSKKEQMELEKWAKAFNEQCMQVENFNLVVE